MDSNSNNNTKSIKRKLFDPLVEGYEFTTQLQLLLSYQHSNNHNQTRMVSGSGSGSGLVTGEPDPVDELVTKILGSFRKAISVLESFDPVADVSVPIAVEGSRNASCGDDSSAPASCNGGDSGDSRKRLGVAKGKRGCYTRKKRAHTWTVEARRIDDIYAWRKYGQKEILNTKFPRSYFRCTHKQAQGCKATKQVQKQEQDPEMFQITYIGHHTCNVNDQTQAKTEPFDHGIIMDSDNTMAATIVHDHVNAKVQEQENNISSVTVVGASTVKEEENQNGESKEYCEASSTCEDLSLVWHDMTIFDDHELNHQNHYYHGETNTTSHNFAFDNDQFSSLFDSYCAYEGTSAI